MSESHLVIPDCHAHPDFNNKRAEWLGNLIVDLKPTKIINMGDTWDFPSLSSYDKGTRSFVGRSYSKDVEAGCEFNDKLFWRLNKQKKRKPKKVFIIGNHEYRTEKVLELEPHLEGSPHGVSLNNLQLEDHYDEVIHYQGKNPGITTEDGVSYAHYITSGGMGRPIGGINHAGNLLSKCHSSVTVAHSHTVDFAVRNSTSHGKIMGLVAGYYQDYQTSWAGRVTDEWWSGVIFCNNVSQGRYDPQFISMNTIKKEYSK